MTAHRLSQPERDDTTDLGTPSVPGLPGDANLPTRLDCANPGLQQLPVPSLDFQVPFPTSTSHRGTVSDRAVLRRALEPMCRKVVSFVCR